MKYATRVAVRLKPGVLDAEGKNVKKALDLLNIEVEDVASIKTYEVILDRPSEQEARATIEEACRRLLANPVVHDFEISLRPVAEQAGAPARK